MPDLLDDLRRYGDAVEAAAIDRQPPDYLAVPAPPPRRPRRLALAAAAVVLAVLAVTIAVTGEDRSGDVRVDTPPTPVSPTSLPTELLAPVTAATEIAASDATWEPLDPGPLEQRWGSAVVWTGDQMVVWGGGGGDTDWEPYSDGAAYDPATDRWSLVPAAPIPGRAHPVAAWTGTEVLVWGGGGGDTDWEPHADGAAYDPASQTWRMLPRAPLPVGPFYSGAWTGEELVIVGGSAEGLQSAAYDPATDSWRPLASIAAALPAPGWGLDVSWTGSRIVVVEVFPSGEPTQVFVYDPATDHWSSSRPDRFVSRQVASAVLDGRLFVASYMQPTDRTASFDPVTGEWTAPVSALRSDPSGDTQADGIDRSHPGRGCERGSTLVAMDTSFFATACGRSGFYDPADATWQRVAAPPEGAPSAPEWIDNETLWWGSDRTVVWTGDDILWWGSNTGEADGEAASTGLWRLRP